MNSKTTKSTSKIRRPQAAEKESSRPGRERRPSDKIAAQVLEQQEADLIKTQKQERRALREKKALQKANKLANLPSDGEGDYEPRTSPTFVSREVVSKPSQITLSQRSGKVPPAPTVTSQRVQQLTVTIDDSQSQRAQQSQRVQQSQFDEGLSQRAQQSQRIQHSQFDEGLSQGAQQPQRVQASQIDEGLSQRVQQPRDEDQLQQQTLLVSPAKSVTSIVSLSSTESHSPLPRTKRDRVDSDDEDVFQVQVSKAQKISPNSGRPKAADYESAVKEIILAAANLYRVLLVSQRAFPSSSEEVDLVKSAWKRVNEDNETEIKLTPDIVRIVKARGSQARGEAKTKTASLVEALYGFDSARSKKAIAENRKKVEELKSDKGFVFEVLSDSEGKRKGIYKHPILQKAVNAMWFQNKRDEGIVFHDLFNPISVPSIALILTAIECNLDEWISGTKTEVTFWADDYRAIYESHVLSLNAFGKYSKSKGVDLLGLLQRKLYNYGRLHAGVSTFDGGIRQAIPQSAFADAVDEYVGNSETDDDGDMLEA